MTKVGFNLSKTKHNYTINMNLYIFDPIFSKKWQKRQYLKYSIIAGLPNTNMEGDLKVEHQNCDFKAGLLNLSGHKI